MTLLNSLKIWYDYVKPGINSVKPSKTYCSSLKSSKTRYKSVKLS